MDETPTSQIVESPVQTVDAQEPAGVPEGTILTTPADGPDERVVYDLNDNGEVIGWHKESVNG